MDSRSIKLGNDDSSGRRAGTAFPRAWTIAPVYLTVVLLQGLLWFAAVTVAALLGPNGLHGVTGSDASVAAPSWPVAVNLISRLITIAVCLLAVRMLRADLWSTFGLRVAPVWVYPVGILFTMAVWPWEDVLLEGVGLRGQTLGGAGEGAAPLIALLACLTNVIVAPVAEEALFRGYILRSLEQRSRVVALLGSASLFSLWHIGFGDALGFLAVIPFALALGYLALMTGSIYPCAAAHAFWNLLAFSGASISGLHRMLVLVLAATVIILGSVLLWRHRTRSIAKQDWVKENRREKPGAGKP